VKSYYRESYYEDKATGVSAALILPFVVNHYHPRHAIDIGCGNGVWLNELKKLGVEDVTGVDGPHIKNPFDPGKFIVADLRETYPEFTQKFDVCLCLEVAEHLPPEKAESFVDYLATASNVIIFGAAIPGQGGHGHLNCQWQGYWVEKFRRRGFRALDWLRTEIWNDSRIAQFYRQNIVALEYHPDSPYSIFQDVVHPEFYIWKMQTLKAFGDGI
jgi:SAM-dependent methyltransferase